MGEVEAFEGLDGVLIKEINSKDGTFKLDCRLDADQENALCVFYLTPSSNLTFSNATAGQETIHYEIQAAADSDGLIKGFADGFGLLSFDHATTITVNANSLVVDYSAANRCDFGICETKPEPSQQK